MDELQISGKRYISSRRIAKENGYHTDYIGQLIRGGKIKGQKVGRSWYVEASSFAAYLGQPEAAVAREQERAAEERPRASVAPEPVVPEPTVAPVVVAPLMPGYIPSAPLVAHTPQSTQKITQPVVLPVVEQKEEQTFSIPLRKEAEEPAFGGLRYVADESSLPEIARTERVFEPESQALVPAAAYSAHAESRPMRARRALGLVLAGVVAVFIFSAVVSSGLVQTINIEAGNPASAGYALHW